MPKARARVKGHKDPAVLLRSMVALLHLEAGAEDRPAATVRQVMGTASHKADDGGPEGRHDAMPTDTAEPALTGGRCRIGPGLFPLAGREQVTPAGGGTELSPVIMQSLRSWPEARATIRKNWQRSQLSPCAGRAGVAEWGQARLTTLPPFLPAPTAAKPRGLFFWIMA